MERRGEGPVEQEHPVFVQIDGREAAVQFGGVVVVIQARELGDVDGFLAAGGVARPVVGADGLAEEQGQGRAGFGGVHVVEDKSERPPIPTVRLGFTDVVDVELDSGPGIVAGCGDAGGVVVWLRSDDSLEQGDGRVLFVLVGADLGCAEHDFPRFEGDVEAGGDAAVDVDGLGGVADERHLEPAGPLVRRDFVRAVNPRRRARACGREGEVDVGQGLPSGAVEDATADGGLA